MCNSFLRALEARLHSAAVIAGFLGFLIWLLGILVGLLKFSFKTNYNLGGAVAL